MAEARAKQTRSEDGPPGARYWQIWPQYELEVRLEPQQARAYGSGTVTFENTSPDSLREVVLRLDQNRFLEPRVGDVEATSGIELRSLSINGVSVPLSSPRVSGLRSTVGRISLAEQLLPDDTLRIEVAWTFEVPEGQSLRQGRSGDSIFQIAQWYPRLAMYDDLGGWDTAPHIPSLEFYNPFASFNVVIAAPSDWLVGATGELLNPPEVLSRRSRTRLALAAGADTSLLVFDPKQEGAATAANGGALHWRFVADSVRDFAWGASPRYTWAVASRTRGTSDPLIVHALMTHGSAEDVIELADSVADILMLFSNMLVPYPGGTHTLLAGPERAMEYPLLTLSGNRPNTHELAHQWFPMVVGTDETRFVFLDEGVAMYLAEVDVGDMTLSIPEPLLSGTDIRELRPTAEYGYFRGALMLQCLAERFGEREVLAALRAYTEAWQFRHPTPWDFMAMLEGSLGADLDPFWVKWLFLEDHPGSCSS